MPESPFSTPPKADDTEVFESENAAAADAMSDLKKAAEVLGGRVNGDAGDPATEERAGPELKEQPDFGVSPEVKEAYIRSLLSGEPFKLGFSLFRDTVNVVFRSRTIRETKLARRAAGMIDEAGDGAYWACLLAYSIDELTVGDLRITRRQLVSEDGVDLTPLYALSDITYYAVLSKFREFEDMCDDLFRKADSPDF